MGNKPKTRQAARYVSDKVFKIEVVAELGHVIMSIDDTEYELSPTSAEKVADILQQEAFKARESGKNPPTTPSGHSGKVL